jgi:chromosomal replication initiation ATPase DnaA
MTRQLRLFLRRPVSYALDAFVRGPSNAQAIDALQAWPDWHGRAMALVGPEGVGKTHLARHWAQRTGAVVLERATP